MVDEEITSGATPQVFCHYNTYILCHEPKTVEKYATDEKSYGMTKVVVQEPIDCDGCQDYKSKATPDDVKTFLDVIGNELDPDLLKLIKEHQSYILK